MAQNVTTSSDIPRRYSHQVPLKLAQETEYTRSIDGETDRQTDGQMDEQTGRKHESYMSLLEGGGRHNGLSNGPIRMLLPRLNSIAVKRF